MDQRNKSYRLCKCETPLNTLVACTYFEPIKSDQGILLQVMEVAKMLTSCIVKVLEESSLAMLVSQDTLMELERDVIAYLTDERLLGLEDVAQLIRVFNYLMLRLCENCDKTAVCGSLLQLLAKSMGSNSTQRKQTEIIMKARLDYCTCVCLFILLACLCPLVFLIFPLSTEWCFFSLFFALFAVFGCFRLFFRAFFGIFFSVCRSFLLVFLV